MPQSAAPADLTALADRLAAGDLPAARARLDELLAALADRADPAALQARIFAGAMAGTLGAEAAAQANLYLRAYELSQIRLFDLLAGAVPLVSVAREVGNRMALDHLRGHEQAVLIDIGIGSGTQEAALVEALGALPDGPRRLTVYGIEVSAESLDVAEAHLAAAGARAGVQVTLHKWAQAADALTEAQWAELGAAPGPKVALSSFAFHHIGEGDQGEARDAVLRRLRAAGVGAVVLTEPDSDHLQASYPGRLDQAWRHFGATFGVLDSLPLAEADRSALKALFFGREIADILGTVHGPRAERHEGQATWLRRLRAAGFTPAARAAWSEDIHAPVITISSVDEHVQIGHGGVGIVAVLCGQA